MADKPFLDNISMVYMSPCVADGSKIRFKAQLARNIGQVMPYLSAIIKSSTYNPEANTIFFSKGVRMITLKENILSVAKATDLTDAHKIMDFIKEKVNEAYDNRDNIVPVSQKVIRATALEIFSYLPKTNCRKCGESTCLAFAVKLLLAEQTLLACEPINSNDSYSDHKKEMTELLAAMGLN